MVSPTSWTVPGGRPASSARARTSVSSGPRSWSSGAPDMAGLDSFALALTPKADTASLRPFAANLFSPVRNQGCQAAELDASLDNIPILCDTSLSPHPPRGAFMRRRESGVGSAALRAGFAAPHSGGRAKAVPPALRPVRTPSVLKRRRGFGTGIRIPAGTSRPVEDSRPQPRRDPRPPARRGAGAKSSRPGHKSPPCRGFALGRGSGRRRVASFETRALPAPQDDARGGGRTRGDAERLSHCKRSSLSASHAPRWLFDPPPPAPGLAPRADGACPGAGAGPAGLTGRSRWPRAASCRGRRPGS